ncbi:MAG TPA: GntR family transcriptional regulator [Spirochaetota bacterium]|nr:GntR family transcriptional regulator [Spirochaetota bacterium]HOD15352.1 GntR family transcriptional regulator [Spirochaetota bacterium]HPG51398.1 GntR family transcriptional regulator [Spirochaetota bacterium]HPN11771.1 GntR family transcriptional regulator [Spirochaetota bacterium]HQL82927.1 GntR family transcriptional regulator [Spirochaetota bacterium]
MEFKASKNLPEQIALYLGDRIMRFGLKPGQRLVEEELSRELGVSRSPLREALRILEKKWLVDLIPRREARVTILNENLISCSGDILKEVYGLVARKAAELGTEEDRTIITEKLGILEEQAVKNNPVGYYEAIMVYEGECLRAARNPVLNLLLNDLWPSSRRVQYATLHLRTESLMEPVTLFKQAHQNLMEGNGDRAAAIIRDLIQQETIYAIKYLPKFDTL